MVQRWHHLLFAHWRCPATDLRPLISSPLEIDTFDDTAWIGVVPFYMSGVRTYVTLDGRPGVWFFSLDAASSVAVLGARIGGRLKYFRASMQMSRDRGKIVYRSDGTAPMHPTANGSGRETFITGPGTSTGLGGDRT